MPGDFANCRTLIVATGNPHKFKEFERLLRPLTSNIVGLFQTRHVSTVEENESTLRGNSRKKASEYARQLGEWVISDDTGLEVETLEGRPGVRSSRFAGPNASSEENIKKLLQELNATGAALHPARFVCHLALADPNGDIYAEAQGQCHGRIVTNRQGTGGFGYDSHFELVEYHKTLAELGPDSTDVLGHRGRATRALIRSVKLEDHGVE